VSRLAAPAAVLVLATALALAVAPPAAAHSRVAAAVTTTSVSYRFDAQLVSGPHAGTSLHGWLSGTLDSTGLFTATLVTDVLSPLTPGCAPHVDFGPACALPPTANVGGHIQGKGASSSALLTATGKGWTWLLAGSAVGGGSWAGTLTGGSAYLGSWTLTPHVSTLSIQAGTRADPKSKHKVVLVGAIDLNVTADGLAVGTFSPADGTLPRVVQGYVNAQNGSVEVRIPMGKTGTVLLTAWSRPGFGVLNWTGTFVGPAAGDYGTWIGRG
jgi:hypothetical protein